MQRSASLSFSIQAPVEYAGPLEKPETMAFGKDLRLEAQICRNKL